MRFSIITCTYNSEKYIEKNIESIKDQTFQNFEHIFIDGFSGDKTIAIIKKYQLEFPHKVKLFQFKPKGISNAMNRGIEKSQGEYVIHLHSDDNFYDNQVLESVNYFLQLKNNPDWIYGKANVIEEDTTSVGIFPKYKFLQLDGSFLGKYLLKFINFVPHQSVFIKPEVFVRYGKFNEKLKSKMDFDLWLRLRRKTNWIFFDRIISNYMIRPGAQSSSKKNRKENQFNLKKVQKQYMNKFELSFSYLINSLINKINKTLR